MISISCIGHSPLDLSAELRSQSLFRIHSPLTELRAAYTSLYYKHHPTKGNSISIGPKVLLKTIKGGNIGNPGTPRAVDEIQHTAGIKFTTL